MHKRRRLGFLLVPLLFAVVAAALVPGRRAAAEGNLGRFCRCSKLVVSSKDRFMRGAFGLECRKHTDHGTCALGTVPADVGHSAGCGAMTGSITVTVGSKDPRPFVRKCPDDHKTCFRGPSRCDDGGSWANVCSCDTVHSSAAGDKKGAFQSGPLEDSAEQVQFDLAGAKSQGKRKNKLGDIRFEGACSENQVTVAEFVEEHDATGGSEALGTLTVNAQLPDGSGRVERPVSQTLTNGGFSGDWGATIVVTGTCKSDNCCRRCGPKGKACGDTCIQMKDKCNTPMGCACD